MTGLRLARATTLRNTGGFKPGDYVTHGGRLYVVASASCAGVDGDHLLHPVAPESGEAVRLPARLLDLAVVGDDVCEKPPTQCQCSLAHAPEPEKLIPVPRCPAGHGPMIRQRHGLTVMQDWCGVWFRCRHAVPECHNSYLFPSAALLREKK